MSDESLEEAAEKNASWAMTEIGQLRKERDAALADRDLHAQSAEVWRKRVEAAAEALADVLPGEVGRLDLLARIAELMRQRDEWRRRAESLLRQAEGFEAEIARLRPSGQVAEDADLLEIAIARVPCNDRCASELPDGPWAVKPPCDCGWADLAPALLRLAAKAQGYDAAVADNAALLKALLSSLEVPISHELRLYVRAKFEKEPHLGAALLEQHRMEVAQARNEALEAVANMLDSETGKGLGFWAGRVRAMKTCTDASCAMCKAGEPCH